jgi:Bacterial Ig-like domain (group 2)
MRRSRRHQLTVLPSYRLTVFITTLAVLSCTDVLTDSDIAPIASVRIAPDSMDVPIGSAARVEAFPLDSTGAFRPGSAATWSTSDASIATVDDTGGVTGVGAGTATITATVKGIEGTARVRVGPSPAIAVDADTIVFNAQAGQGSPPAQDVAITNAGGLTLSGLTVGTIDYGVGPQFWILTSLDTTVAPATLTLTAATGAITQAGTYAAKVPLIAAGAANSPDTVTVVLIVVPGPPTTYQMTITAGDNQQAIAGTTLPVNPEVTITDSFDNPIIGLPVTFVVTAGGGGITGGTINTDVNGVAAVGSWTIQATGAVPADGRFINQLQVSAPSAGSSAFTALAYFSYTATIHPMWPTYGCAGCHGNANLGGLQLNGTAAATHAGELLNVPTGCATGALIQVSSAGGIVGESNSLFMAKLDNTSPAACPAPMPPSGVLIPAAVRDTIRAWIRAGAPLN